MLRLLQTLKEAAQLDLAYLNTAETSEEINLLKYDKYTGRGGIGLSKGLSRAFNRIAKKNDDPSPHKGSLQSKLWLYLDTTNQYNATKELLPHLPEYAVLGNNPHSAYRFKEWKTYLLSTPFIIPMLKYYFSTTGYARRSTKHYFFRIWHTYGLYIAQKSLLMKQQPALLILVNDHVNRHRCMNLAARKLGIKTAYIQHAPIRSGLPPLNFNFAILEGLDSVAKYEREDESTKIYLAGIAKADQYVKNPNLQPSIQHLGICSNDWHDIQTLGDVISIIVQELPELEITFRPHPGDYERRNDWKSMAELLHLKWSDPVNESGLEFLNGKDAVLSDDSGIHLEAALRNILPIHYDFLGEKLDFYGFIASGLVFAATDTDHLIALLKGFMQDKPDVKQRAQPYCHTLKNRFEGRSSELIAELISDLLSDTVSPETWTELTTPKGAVYEPL